MNPADLMKVAGAKKKFDENHPRVEPFLRAVAAKGVPVDTVVEMKVTTPDGESMTCNIKVKPDDRDLLDLIKGLALKSKN